MGVFVGIAVLIALLLLGAAVVRILAGPEDTSHLGVDDYED